MTISATTGVRKDVDDLYGDHFTVALAQAMSRLECAPYWHQGEKAPARLVRAAELVRLSRVQLHDERTATVYGSTKAYDLTGYHCTCPQSQKGSTHWCVHAVSVKLARTLAEHVRPADPDDEAYPVDDETLPLPLPPTSVDERLAQAATAAAASVSQHPALDRGAPAPLSRTCQHCGQPDSEQAYLGHLQCGHVVCTRCYSTLCPCCVAQEDPMTEDPASYIPEPDDAPVRVVEPQTITIERPGGRPTTVPLAPQDDDLERALQVWTTQRQVVQRFLKQELRPEVDYYTLKIGNRESKPSLSKAGSEKVLGWLKWTAQFTPDTGTWEMLGRPTTLVCYLCTLHTRSGEVVGEGRGARYLEKDKDINKSIKMAQKSAQVDAVLRTGCLSDVFSQDVEDLQETPAPPAPTRPTSQALRQRIWTLVQHHAPHLTSREDVERFVQRATGYPLHPDRYAEIVAALEKHQP